MIDFIEPDDAAILQAISIAVCEEIFAERPELTVSAWADEHRRLSSESSAEAGQFETDRIPYMRWVQDLLTNDLVTEIVCGKSAQVAFSTIFSENLVGYTMGHDPSGLLVVWPTEKALRHWSTKRLAPMVRDTEVLAALFPESGRRTSRDSIHSKLFPGGYLAGLSAKSSADIRSFSARRIVAEEVDEYEALRGQGDVIELLRRRASTFWNRKLVFISTPTLYGMSRIWTELESSTWHQFYVPCPHCGHFQTLRWIDEEVYGHASPGTYRVLFDRDAAGELILGTCRYLCEACTEEIPERYKMGMLQAGAAAQDHGGGWIARFPDRWPHKVGVHINTLYSPIISWNQFVQSFLGGRKSPDLMQGFDNTMRGVPYEESAEERVSSHFLAKRAEPFPVAGDEELVPRGVGLLTAYVDVQGDRLELFVWGWGADERSWVMLWQQFYGDPGHVEVWKELDARLLKGFTHEDGAPMAIACVTVDAGFQTDMVWRFCEARKHRRILATVGRGGRGRKLIEAPTPHKFKKARSQKKPMHVIGVDSGKDLLAARLKITDESKAGYVHFSNRLDPVFFEQITSERLMTRYRYGRPARVWLLPPGLTNEALDGAVGSMAALAFLGMPVVHSLGKLAEQVSARGRAIRDGAVPVKVTRPRMLSRGLPRD